MLEWVGFALMMGMAVANVWEAVRHSRGVKRAHQEVQRVRALEREYMVRVREARALIDEAAALLATMRGEPQPPQPTVH